MTEPHQTIPLSQSVLFTGGIQPVRKGRLNARELSLSIYYTIPYNPLGITSKLSVVNRNSWICRQDLSVGSGKIVLWTRFANSAAHFLPSADSSSSSALSSTSAANFPFGLDDFLVTSFIAANTLRSTSRSSPASLPASSFLSFSGSSPTSAASIAFLGVRQLVYPEPRRAAAFLPSRGHQRALLIYSLVAQ